MFTFEPAQLAAWLKECELQHESCHEDQTKPLLSVTFHEDATSNFRLLDLERGCIVSASFSTRYVTLSHVGNSSSPQIKLNKDSFGRLSTEGTFDSERVQVNLPSTVNDAIRLVHALGERYLWVDTLCLVQDDRKDLAVGISLRYAIFRNASFAIVAAAGTCTGSGLVTRTGASVGENSIDERIDIRSVLSESAYGSQAKTLTELASSQRAVLLTDKGVFFSCRQGTYTISDGNAANLFSLTTTGAINRIPGPLDGVVPSLEAYIYLSEECSQKTLDREGDALCAFHGVNRPLLAGMRTTGVEGLPGYFINAFLLFRTLPLTNKPSTSQKGRRRPEFASFSWAGWDGGIKWLFDDMTVDDGEKHDSLGINVVRWLKHDSLVEWNELTPSSIVNQLNQTPVSVQESNLAKFLREHAHLFPELSDLGDNIPPDHIDNVVINNHFPIYSQSSSGRLDMVDWDEDVLSLDQNAEAAPREQFPLWAFDLASSHVELNRLLLQLGPQISERALRSWSANRRYRVGKFKAQRKDRGKASEKTMPAPYTPHYRRPRLHVDSEKEKARLASDKRAVNARTQDTNANIPNFPPYSVLYAWAVYLKMTLGIAGGQDIHDRISLVSASGDEVGFLYPDDAEVFPSLGSEANLIILGKANHPHPGNGDAELWVLCIQWRVGIAERQGIGRIAVNALDDAVAPGPSIKRILLG